MDHLRTAARGRGKGGALAGEIDNLGDYIRKGQIEILDYSQWYTLGGKFEADAVLQGWVEKLEAARKRGFDGLRLSGNTFWLEKSDWQDFTEYEAMVDGVIGRYPMLAICTYSLAKCGAVEIMDVVSNHAFALIKRAGKWQIVESAERKRMEAALRESEERLRAAALAAEIGVWSWTPGTDDIIVSGNWRQLFGLAPEAHVTFETWRNAVHPDDRDRAFDELNIASRATPRLQHRVPRGLAGRNGTVAGGPRAGVLRHARPGHRHGRRQRGHNRPQARGGGAAPPARVAAGHPDQYRRRRLATDTAGRITFLNPRAAESTGWTEEEALGRPVQDVFRIINERTREEAEDIVGRVLREGCVVCLANETALVTRDGREIPDRGQRGADSGWRRQSLRCGARVP